MAWCIVKEEQALGPALGEAFKDVDGLIDLLQKIVGIKVPIAVFSRLKDDPGFPDGCEKCEIKV